MPYRVDWAGESSALHLYLIGDVTMDEFVAINAEIMAHLGDETAPLALVVDTSAAKSVPHAFTQLKDSQVYATKYKTRLKWIVVIAEDRLMRLMMMLTYNLCRPSLYYVDTPQQADDYLERVWRARH